MNRIQFNSTEMFNTTRAIVQAHNSLWGGIPALVQTMAELNQAIQSMGAKIMHQQTPITGAAEQKANVRGDFEDKILEIAHQVSALGAANHDMNLAAQGDVALSQLDQMADDALEETGQRIGDLMTANLSALEDYGLIGDDLEALNNLKTAFHAQKTAPRAMVAERKGETDTLPELIRSTKTLLRTRLDKQMTRFKKTQPVFYAAYLTARVIVDKGHPPAPAKAAPAKQPAP